jgi:hypothetical protein
VDENQLQQFTLDFFLKSGFSGAGNDFKT